MINVFNIMWYFIHGPLFHGSVRIFFIIIEAPFCSTFTCTTVPAWYLQKKKNQTKNIPKMAVFGDLNNSTGNINRSFSSLDFQLVIHSPTIIAGTTLNNMFVCNIPSFKSEFVFIFRCQFLYPLHKWSSKYKNRRKNTALNTKY